MDGWKLQCVIVCHIYTVSLMCHLLPGSCGQFKDPSSTVPAHSKQEDHPKWRCTCTQFPSHDPPLHIPLSSDPDKKIGVTASKQVTRGCINSNPSSKGFVTFVFAYVHRSWWVVEWRTVTYRDHWGAETLSHESFFSLQALDLLEHVPSMLVKLQETHGVHWRHGKVSWNTQEICFTLW